MSDLENRLRAELRRRAASVEPSPDLPQRIDARVRRRARQRRMVGSAALAGAMVALGGGAAAGALISGGHNYTRVTAAGSGPRAHRSGSHAATAHPSRRTSTTPGATQAASSTTATTTGATGTTLAQAAPPSSQPPLPECTTAQLAVRAYPAPGEARGGHLGMILVLLNASSQSCVMHGYVGLGLYDAAGAPIPSRAVRGPTYFRSDPGPRTVVLRPGGTASTDVTWSDVPTAGGGCEPPSATLEVTPPNQTTQLKVALDQTVCDHGDLHTTALVAGSNGPPR